MLSQNVHRSLIEYSSQYLCNQSIYCCKMLSNIQTNRQEISAEKIRHPLNTCRSHTTNAAHKKVMKKKLCRFFFENIRLFEAMKVSEIKAI